MHKTEAAAVFVYTLVDKDMHTWAAFTSKKKATIAKERLSSKVSLTLMALLLDPSAQDLIEQAIPAY